MPGRGNPNINAQLIPDVAVTRDGMTVPVNLGTAPTSTSIFTPSAPADYSMPSGNNRQAYENAMADRYANTLVSPGINIFGTDIGKQYGYTGQGSQSMAGINAPSNTNPGGGSVSGGVSRAQSTGPAPIPEVLISQDLSQRTPSGSVYAPDLSAYYDSSLFNYAGPGGVDEYTYGQGLRTDGADYSIFGSPADIANPYYEGQFAPLPTSQPQPTGPADSAITMPAIQMPGNLPQIINNTVPSVISATPAIGGGSGTTQISPTQVGSVSSEANPGLTEAMAGSDKEYQDMLTASLSMDQQLMNQLDSSDPRGGEAELNQNVGKLPQDSSMADNQAQADMAMGNRAGYQDSERFLARDVAAGMNDNLTELMAKGQALQDRYDAQERIQTKDRVLDQQFDRNQAEYVPTISDYFPDASPLGFAETAGDKGFTPKIGPKTGPSGLTANDVVVDTTPSPTLSDVTDATPMQFANNAGQMEASNTSLFDAKREDSPFAKGPAQEIKNIFDEQQNYEVPASEMSPGETGLINGIVEGLKAFGPNDERSMGEQKAWDRYGDYKSAGAKALNKGEIDEKAFNEIKGKAGSETVINHFVDSSKNPKTNNFMTNASNIFYQAMDVIVGDDSIKDGIVDYYQQKKGVNSTDPLGSVAEEIAKAKKATQQRKEVQENIFTPGPMKFAAVASKPKPTPVKSSPAIRTSSQKNVISKPKAKPGGRAGAGATTNKYSSFARNYGGRYGL